VVRIIEIILRQMPMLEQLCFHDYERNVLADQVLEKFASRIDGHFNEKQAAAFRPWNWMEQNRKVLVVRYLLKDMLWSQLVTNAVIPLGIEERCRPRE
jgi:hypothetical protein